MIIDLVLSVALIYNHQIRKPSTRIVLQTVPRTEGHRMLSYPEKVARILNRIVGIKTMVAYSEWEATHFNKAGLLVIAEDESFKDAGIILLKDTIVFNMDRMPQSAIDFFHLPKVGQREREQEQFTPLER